MRIKRYFLPLIFIVIVASLLHSCDMSVSIVDEDMSPTPSATASNTAVPVASLTSTPTLTPPATITPFPTFVLSYLPTTPPDQQWLTCPGIVVTRTDTDKGDILHILRCEDGLEYDLGPLAKGVFAVGPNNKFLVYVTIDGFIYASRIDDPHLIILYNVAREHIYSVFNKKVAPDFKLSFVEGPLNYKLILLERNYYQKRVYELPAWITR